MKKFAKLLAMVLAVSMVLTMFVGAVDYTDAAKINKDKAADVEAVYNYGIMQGNNKGEFNPTANLTRDEMAKIMFALEEIGLDASNKAIFSSFFADAASIPAWSKGYIGYAFQKNILVGNAKNEVNATGTLTYIEAAIMLMRALGLEDPATENEPAEYTGDKWYQNAVMDAVDNDLFDGLDIADFKANITREDVAVMIVNVITNDATKAAAAEKFDLATEKTGVVVGKETVEDVDYFVVDGVDGDADYAMGELELADFIGKEVVWTEEGDGEDKVIISEIAALTQAVVDVELGEIKYDAEKKTLTIGNIVIEKADELMEAPAYYFIETELAPTYTLTIADMLTKLAAVAADEKWQEVTVVLNETSISVFDAGITFVMFDKDEVEASATYNTETKTWDYSYTYGEYTITEEMTKIEDDTILAVKIVDGKVEIVGYPEFVSFEDLVVKNTKDGYVITVDGEEMDLYGDIDIDFLYDNQGEAVYTEDDVDYNIYLIVYEGLILGVYGEEIEEEEAELVYGIVIDWTIAPAELEDKDENKQNVNLATVAVVIDGEVKTIKVADGSFVENGVYLIGEDANFEGLNTLTGTSTVNALIKTYAISEDGKTVTFGTARKSYTVKVEDVLFIDLSGNGYGVADYAIAENGVVSIGGETTAPNSALYVRLGSGDDAQYIVVYDAEGEFDIYDELVGF